MEFLVCRTKFLPPQNGIARPFQAGSSLPFQSFLCFHFPNAPHSFLFPGFALSVSYPQNAFPPEKCWIILQSWPLCYSLYTVFLVSLPSESRVTPVLCSHCVFITSVLLNLSNCLWASQSLAFRLFLGRNNVLSLINSKHF